MSLQPPCLCGCSNFRCHISEFLGQELIASWNFAGSKHPIYEFELVAVLMGIKLLTSYLRYKAVFVFTDNEGALVETREAM